MTCRDFERALERSRDDGDGALASVRTHATGCLRCARLLAAETRMRESLASLRQRPREGAVRLDLARSARREAEARHAAQPPPVSRWALAALATSAALFAAAVIFGPSDATRSSRPGTTLAAAEGAVDPLDVAPVVWSDGLVDVVAPAPPPRPEAVAVLVEWNL